jgi:hypothetical protein
LIPNSGMVDVFTAASDFMVLRFTGINLHY